MKKASRKPLINEDESTPKEYTKRKVDASIDSKDSKNIGAIILVCIGFLFLLSNFGYFEMYQLGRLWPVILIAIGLMMLYRK